MPGFLKDKSGVEPHFRPLIKVGSNRTFAASSAEELKAALAQTVATSFSVYRGNTEVAGGSLGSAGIMVLPEGDYRVRLDSSPPVEANVRLSPRESVTLTLEKRDAEVLSRERRGTLPHTSCDDPGQFNQMLGAEPR